MKTFRVALAQINPAVGDLLGNSDKITGYIKKAKRLGVDLIAFPELSITGYPPEDLLLTPSFIDDNLRELDRIRKSADGITAVVGFVDRKEDIFNAAAVISNKRLVDVYHKIYLPNYGIFDEFRYFQAGRHYPIYDMKGVLTGINICEDIWYPEGPARSQALRGAELIININASPYTIGKGPAREKMLSTRAADSSIIVAFVNLVGAQDELVFEGGSMIIDSSGAVTARARMFEEDLLVADLDMEAVFLRRLQDPRRRQQALSISESDTRPIKVPGIKHAAKPKLPKRRQCIMEEVEEIYSALRLGVSDYTTKNGFKSAVIGLSGGVDSSLVAAIAVDALGKDFVKGVFMPSRFTSKDSMEDAFALAKNLGITITEVPISSLHDMYLDTLKAEFKGRRPGTAEENLQARIRGNILMALSNKFGSLVLTTGNKSEMSVGYATLYGDMAGGFAVIKDVPKTLVYRLSQWRNQKAGCALIPQRVLTKEPTAELRANQRDTDSLPPYGMLDPVLKAYVEDGKSMEEILKFNVCDPYCSKVAIENVIRMVDGNEYKRRQSPPGIKITPRAFGKDRRFPITNRYKPW